jgi:hypothetical protein
MPITLGILAQSRQEAAGATFQLLESTVLTGSQASVEFTNLTTKYASQYQHLQLRMVARTSRSTFSDDPFTVQFNNDSTSANYKYHQLASAGPNVFSGAENYMFTFANNTLATGAFGGVVLDILDPFETTKNTTARAFGGLSIIGLSSMAWFNTNSVTSIRIASFTSSNLLQNSRFSLYGIKATA